MLVAALLSLAIVEVGRRLSKNLAFLFGPSPGKSAAFGAFLGVFACSLALAAANIRVPTGDGSSVQTAYNRERVNQPTPAIEMAMVQPEQLSEEWIVQAAGSTPYRRLSDGQVAMYVEQPALTWGTADTASSLNSERRLAILASLWQGELRKVGTTAPSRGMFTTAAATSENSNLVSILGANWSVRAERDGVQQVYAPVNGSPGVQKVGSLYDGIFIKLPSGPAIFITADRRFEVPQSETLSLPTGARSASAFVGSPSGKVSKVFLKH